MEKASTETAGPSDTDPEMANVQQSPARYKSPYAGLGWLDRLLVLWIFLAIVIGILLGNFVENVGPALQRGQFVGVSIPIGTSQFDRNPRTE